jgi:hypothetical protein
MRDTRVTIRDTESLSRNAGRALLLCPPSFDGKKMEMSASRFPAQAERAASGVAPLSKAVRQMAIFAVLPATSDTAARIAAGRTGLETCATPPRPRRCKYLRCA